MSMSQPLKNTRLRKSIKLDKIDASDFNKYNIIYCCEQCTHFKALDESCTIGYKTEPHLKEEQLKRYNLVGAVAFCRFTEID